jgi:hypothetical protein
MCKKILVCAFFLIFTACTALAQDVNMEFEGRYWITDLTAKAKVVESSIGTDFDFKSDLGIKDENFPEARFMWHTSENSKVSLAYTLVNYGGQQDITRTIEFNGKSYTAGTRVNSELDIQYFRLGWTRHLLNLGDKIKVGMILDLKGISADMSLEAPNLIPAINESKSFIGGLPTLGAALEVNPLEKINLFAEISGLPAGSFGYFFDAEAGAKIIPIKNFSVSVGYRIIDIKAENDPDFVKVKISGPFVSGTLRF